MSLLREEIEPNSLKNEYDVIGGRTGSQGKTFLKWKLNQCISLLLSQGSVGAFIVYLVIDLYNIITTGLNGTVFGTLGFHMFSWAAEVRRISDYLPLFQPLHQ